MYDKFEYLLALEKEKHFGRAAQVCGVSQPNLSAALKQLELQFGVMLVDRGARFMGFTPEGLRILDWARCIVGEFRAMNAEIELMKQFGAEGRRLWRLARGIDDRRVVADRDAKTISNETTFNDDIRDLATLEKILWRLSEKVSSRLKSGEVAGTTITLKLKTADFRQRTRSQSIHAPTQLAAKIFEIGRAMLAKEIDGTAFRLIGTGVSALQPGSQAGDTDMIDRRSADAERAMDGLRKKFGAAAVIRGIAYEGPEKSS